MPVPRTDYLSWAIERYGTLRFNLAASGVPPVRADTFDPPPSPDDARAFSRLAAAVAERDGWSRAEVLATAGATGAMTAACAALLGPGDRVLVERPSYEPLIGVPAGFGAAVDRFDRRFEDGWAIDPGAVAAALRPGTRLVLVTEPNNPTGIMSPPEAIAAVAEIAERAGARLLVNEVYRRFHSAPSARKHDPRVLVADSVTKFEGLWWARGGWLAGPAGAVQRAAEAQVTLSVMSPACAAWAAAALARPDLASRALALASADKRRVMDDWVRSRPGLSWVEPPAGLFGFVRVAGPPDLRALAERLQDEHGLLFAPGAFFGAAGAMRVSWAGPIDRLREGLGILGSALAAR